MCNWKKWIWPGILATVLLTVLALLMQARAIEQDLHSKVMTDLTGSYDWAQIDLDGRDLTLSGVAPSEDAVSEALQLSDDIYDVRVAKTVATLLPVADPFALSITKADKKIVLEGSVVDEAGRVALVEAAKAAVPGAEITDNLALARGAPEGFGDLAGFGISQLAMLEEGSASLSGLDFSIKGMAKDLPAHNAVIAALSGALPAEGKLVSQDITVPAISPYTLSATKSAEGIVLEGFMPDDNARSTIVSAAKTVTSGEVSDKLVLGAGMPSGFADLASFGISQMAGLDNGTVSFSDMDLSIKGAAIDKPAFDKVSAALSGSMPAGAKLALQDISVPAISPYTLSAVKSASGIVLEGFVPDEGTRTAFVDAAKTATQGSVTDNLKLGAGAPDGFDNLAGFAIAQLGNFSTGSASLTGMDLSLEGTSVSPSAFDTAKAALAGEIPANGKIVVAEIKPASVSPYVFSASTDAKEVVLEGYVSSDAEKTAALDAAAAANPGLTIVDRLLIADGAPGGIDWAKSTALAISEAGRFSTGKASLVDGQYSLEGVAKTNPDYDALVADGGLPEGLKLASETITRPIADPYTWSFSNMDNGPAELAGFVPNQDLIDDNFSRIKTAIGQDREVINNVGLASGAPKDMVAATALGIETVSRLNNGKAELTGAELVVSGEASSEEAAASVRSDFENAIPSGFTGKHAITVLSEAKPATPEPAPAPAPEPVTAPTPEPVTAPAPPAVEPVVVCQDKLSQELANDVIRFETNKAVIKPDSFELLDRIAVILTQCSSGVVEIAGHTDSDGSDDYNLTLSRDRAEAVRVYMVNKGISAGQMKATGYGETKPVADNSTPEGKALNRRIEFTVAR